MKVTKQPNSKWNNVPPTYANEFRLRGAVHKDPKMVFTETPFVFRMWNSS